MKLGSLFDGSGGFPLAGALCGITPVWASEVEPYPIAVTKSRFPDMVHLGDVSKVSGADIEPVDVITFGSPCFPAGTLVLTDKGYAPIEELRCGDVVFTHAGNWKPISAIGHKQSKTVVMKGNHYGIVATPNHPFYSAEQVNRWGGNGYTRTLEKIGQWTEADKMQGKRWAVPNAIQGISIPPIQNKSAKQNDPPVIDTRLMYIIGRYLGDGWIRDGQRPNRPEGQRFGQLFICANSNKADFLEGKMRDVFDGISAVSRFSERTVEKFRVTNQALCEWIKENFGSKAHGKGLPARAYCMKQEMREALLKGYIDSDGYHHKENTWKATTVSKKLVHGVRLLAETLGYSCSVHFTDVRSTTVIEGRTVTQKPQYQVVIRKESRTTAITHGAHNWYKCRSVEPYSEEQTVYNIAVDDDHSYIVEGFVVHNCQDLSVAGKRAGLKHTKNGDNETTRSGLFMEAVRIIKEMRDKSGGIHPAFAVWENVPGAFSSNKGEDFRIVLEELAKVADPDADVSRPPKGKWPKEGGIMGDGWSVAWRTMDAQGWGVPQRRRRIYLVADFTGDRAGKILFEREGLRWHTAEGRTPWQAATADAGGGPAAADREGKLIPYTLKIRSGCEGGGKGALIQSNLSATLATNNDQYLFVPLVSAGFKDRAGAQAGSIGYQAECSPTLLADMLPAVCVCYDARGNGDGETAPTITGDHNNRATDYTALVASCLPINDKATRWQGGGATRNHDGSGNGLGIGKDGDPSPTLTAGDRHAVAYAMQAFGKYAESDKAGALKARDYKDATDLTDLVVFENSSFGGYKPGVGTLKASGGDFGGGSENIVVKYQKPIYIVRRLTPTECARLQGFADLWGVPDHKDDLTDAECAFWQGVRDTYAEINGKTKKQYTKAQLLKWYNGLHTDSAEYKMYGNGVALPCVLYVMQGIADCLEERNGQV